MLTHTQILRHTCTRSSNDFVCLGVCVCMHAFGVCNVQYQIVCDVLVMHVRVCAYTTIDSACACVHVMLR